MKIGVWDIRWALSYLQFQVSAPKKEPEHENTGYLFLLKHQRILLDLVQRKKEAMEMKKRVEGMVYNYNLKSEDV